MLTGVWTATPCVPAKAFGYGLKRRAMIITGLVIGLETLLARHLRPSVLAAWLRWAPSSSWCPLWPRQWPCVLGWRRRRLRSPAQVRAGAGVRRGTAAREGTVGRPGTLEHPRGGRPLPASHLYHHRGLHPPVPLRRQASVQASPAVAAAQGPAGAAPPRRCGAGARLANLQAGALRQLAAYRRLPRGSAAVRPLHAGLIRAGQRTERIERCPSPAPVCNPPVLYFSMTFCQFSPRLIPNLPSGAHMTSPPPPPGKAPYCLHLRPIKQ